MWYSKNKLKDAPIGNFYLFFKGKDISHVDATNHLLLLFVMIALVSFVAEKHIVDLLYGPVSKIVPAIDVFSGATTFSEAAKSFWAFSWACFPVLILWTVWLSFLVRERFVRKVRHFFMAILVGVGCFLLCYFGVSIGNNKESHYISKWHFLLEIKLGIYVFGVCFFYLFYIAVFASIRMLLGWTSWNKGAE